MPRRYDFTVPKPLPTGRALDAPSVDVAVPHGGIRGWAVSSPAIRWCWS